MFGSYRPCAFGGLTIVETTERRSVVPLVPSWVIEGQLIRGI
jgi:hypothetical protein